MPTAQPQADLQDQSRVSFTDRPTPTHTHTPGDPRDTRVHTTTHNLVTHTAQQEILHTTLSPRKSLNTSHKQQPPIQHHTVAGHADTHAAIRCPCRQRVQGQGSSACRHACWTHSPNSTAHQRHHCGLEHQLQESPELLYLGPLGTGGVQELGLMRSMQAFTQAVRCLVDTQEPQARGRG